MDQQALITAIVRQTMVLIARLSTAAGVRSPLERVANEAFISLVRELESQGVGKKVIADMFGLALRSYQQKVQRLSESASQPGITLWQAVHGYLSEKKSVTRAEVLARFHKDGEPTVGGILNDLVENGLVLYSGRGASARYRVATPEELDQLGNEPGAASKENQAALVWVHIYRQGPVSHEHLVQMLPWPNTELRHALELLLARGQIRRERTDEDDYYSTDHCVIPVDQPVGWEASLIDHHRAVSNALAAKVVSGNHAAVVHDEVGGTTATFDFWPGHPREREVRQLLAETRARIFRLFDEITDYNQKSGSRVTRHITFYFGQYGHDEDEP